MPFNCSEKARDTQPKSYLPKLDTPLHNNWHPFINLVILKVEQMADDLIFAGAFLKGIKQRADPMQ